MFAAIRGHNKVAKTLMKCGANPYLCDRQGNTPLHFSAIHKNVQTFKLMLAAGCDPFRKNHAGLDVQDVLCMQECNSLCTSEDDHSPDSAEIEKMKLILKAATSMWLRVLNRGGSNTWGCQNAQKCRLANAFQFLENDNSVFSVKNSHKVHTELVDYTCFFCRAPRKKKLVHETIMLWPYANDGLNPGERWEKHVQFEKLIREDMFRIYFWEQRNFKPLNDIEWERICKRTTNICTRLGVKVGTPQDSKKCGKLSRFYHGSTIGIFRLQLQSNMDKNEKNSKTEETDNSNDYRDVWRHILIHPIFATKDCYKLKIVPRGWTHLSFTFSNEHQRMRIVKNSSISGKKVSIYCGLCGSASTPLWRTKTLRSESSAWQNVKNVPIITESNAEYLQHIFSVPIHSKHCLLTKELEGYGNDTITIRIPSHALGRSNTVYYLKIDSQSFLIGDKNISSMKQKNLAVSPVVECVLATNSSQTKWNRGGVCPSFARRLVLKEFSLSKFLSGSKEKTTDNKPSPNNRPFEPFFISKWPPRFVWNRIDALCQSNPSTTKVLHPLLLNDSLKSRMSPNQSLPGQIQPPDSTSRKQKPDAPSLRKTKNKFRAFVRSSEKLKGLLNILQKRVVHDFYVESLSNCRVSIHFQTPMSIIMAQKIKCFKIEVNDFLSDDPLYTFTLDMKKFKNKCALCKSKPVRPDMFMQGGYILIHQGKQLALKTYRVNTKATQTAIEWKTNQTVEIPMNDIKMQKMDVYTEWVEMNIGRAGISRGNDFVRYNVFTAEYEIHFTLDVNRSSNKIQRDCKVSLTIRPFSYSQNELMKTSPVTTVFATCPICSLASDNIIYKEDDDGDIHREWPPDGFGLNEPKAKHPNNVKVNVLNGHVREDPKDVEQRKNLVQHALSTIPQYDRSRSIDQDNHSFVTLYRKKLALHESIVRNVSNAALFVGDWYGSAFMRSLTYSSKDFFYLTTHSGGVWPESLLVMIITIYLRYEESIAFMMIKDSQKHDFGDVKTGSDAKEYEEKYDMYSGVRSSESLLNDVEKNVESSDNKGHISGCTKAPNVSASDANQCAVS